MKKLLSWEIDHDPAEQNPVADVELVAEHETGKTVKIYSGATEDTAVYTVGDTEGWAVELLDGMNEILDGKAFASETQADIYAFNLMLGQKLPSLE